MDRDVGFKVGDFAILLISSVYTLLVALLHGGMGFGVVRGLRWFWTLTLPGIPWIGSWQIAGLLLLPVLWAAFRPTEFYSRASRGGG